MLDFILRQRVWIGALAIAICLWAWTVEWVGWTYVCPFCRVQRTVIGLLGLMLLFPIHGHWMVRYLSATVGFFGASVAARQHFGGWSRISSGEFALHSPAYYDSFLLSGAALFIISGLVMLLWHGRLPRVTTEDKVPSRPVMRETSPATDGGIDV